jgi:hypothetical protein
VALSVSPDHVISPYNLVAFASIDWMHGPRGFSAMLDTLVDIFNI